jgi:hypothetical protein
MTEGGLGGVGLTARLRSVGGGRVLDNRLRAETRTQSFVDDDHSFFRATGPLVEAVAKCHVSTTACRRCRSGSGT